MTLTLQKVISGINPADSEARRAAELRQSRLTKPPGSLGRLEDLSIQLAGVFSTECPTPRGKTIIVAAADHGVVAQGVTGYPQEVTTQMVRNFLAGGAAINAMARHAGVDLVIVDAGMITPIPDEPSLKTVLLNNSVWPIILHPRNMGVCEYGRPKPRHLQQ